MWLGVGAPASGLRLDAWRLGSGELSAHGVSLRLTGAELLAFIPPSLHLRVSGESV